MEKYPARPIDLTSAVRQIRTSLSTEADMDTVLLPVLPPADPITLADVDYSTPPTETSEQIDLLTRITVAMLPVVREDVPLTQLLAVARQIAALR